MMTAPDNTELAAFDPVQSFFYAINAHVKHRCASRRVYGPPGRSKVCFVFAVGLLIVIYDWSLHIWIIKEKCCS